MTTITIEAVRSAEAIPSDAWRALCPPAHPFLNPDFFAIAERHGAAGPDDGWQATHLVAREGLRIVGLLPLYLKTHSFGDFIHDWGWSPLWERFGQRYYPRLFTGLPHTPVAGPRLLAAHDHPARTAIRRALVDGARRLCEDHGLSSWHVALACDDDLATLAEAGLHVSHDVQFHWIDRGFGDFDGFLASFAAEKRRKVRAERRRVAEVGLHIEVRHGDEIAAGDWPALHALYRSTFDRFGNYAAFSAACLAELAATLGRRMVVFIARDGGLPVAVSLCFRSDDALFGRYWGCAGRYDSLHFELCFYQGIAYCLREGLTRFEPGAGGEHKIARGFVPHVVRSAHWIRDAQLRRTIGAYLARQRDNVDLYRADASGHLPYRRDAAISLDAFVAETSGDALPPTN